MNNDSSTDALIARLSGRNRINAFEAAKEIWNIDANGIAKRLVEVLNTGQRPFNRAAAAYALQMVSTPNIIPALEKTVRSKAEAADVRGHAAETLAHRHRRSTHNLMLKQLSDPSKDVRFWCAFALGQMEERGAVNPLRALLRDNRKVHGFHTVAKEAADTIQIIQNRKPGQRCPYCVRTSR